MIWPFGKRTTWKEHFDRGRSCGSSGELDDAVDHFRKAAKLAPQEPYPHYELGYTYFLQGKYAEALDAWRLTEGLARGFFLVQTEIFICEALLGGALRQESVMALRELRMLTDFGQAQSPRAVELGKGLLAAAPDWALGHYYLGKALFNDDREGSEAALRRCLELSPDDTTAIDALTHIGLHREAAGDFEAARRIWAGVLAVYPENPHTRVTELILSQRQET